MPNPKNTRLLVDGMLGKLTRYLRMCGYDAVSALDLESTADANLVRYAATESRLLVTRDESLAARADGVLLQAKEIDDQLAELDDAGFDLELTAPIRCSRCNGRLETVTPDSPTPSYAPDTVEQPVWKCPRCDQHYWKGSHWDAVARTLEDL